MKKRFSALSLALFVLFGSVLCVPFPSVRADGVIDDLVYYALTVSGYMGVQYNSGGGSHSFGHGITATTPTVGGDTSKTMLENLRDAFQYAYDNHNISVDASGDYVFDSTVTNEFYNIIQGSGIGGYKARYFSVNPSFDDFTTGSSVNGLYLNAVNDAKAKYSNYLYMSYYRNQYVWNANPNSRMTAFVTYDISSVAYMSITGGSGTARNSVTFYGSDNLPVSVPFYYVSQGCLGGYEWYPIYSKEGQTSSTLASFTCLQGTPGIERTVNFSVESSYFTYELFPNWLQNNRYPVKFDSNKDTIFGDTESDARSAYLYSQNPSSIVVNNYNVLPSIPGVTLDDTDFRLTYKQYVDNVNNTYNVDNQTWDPEVFRTVAKDQTNLILNAINQGVGDITGAIESLEDKVQRILNVLSEIRNLLANGSGSGGSGGGLSDAQYQAIIGKLDSIIDGQFSPADLDPILSELSSIDTGVGLNRDQLLLINNKLVQIYNALVTGNNSPNNPHSDNYTYGDNYYINNETDINNDLDILGDNLEIDTRFLDMPDLLRDVVPFCFVVAAGTLINKLAADPEPPYFEIPFSLPAFGIDETIVIDFSDFEELHTILTAGFSILFVVGCMYLEFKLLDHIYRMMS